MKRKKIYKELWKLLIDREMKKTNLWTDARISSFPLATIEKDEIFATDVLLRSCYCLYVGLNDIVETLPDDDTVIEVKTKKCRRNAA